MKSWRTIICVLILFFFCLGFTGQIGTQYSRPGNLQLGAKTSVPITAPTINVSLVRLSIVRLISATVTVAVTAPSAFSSELGTVTARVGNFVLGKLPALNVAITTLLIKVPVTKSIVVSAVKLFVSTGSSSLIRIILTVRVLPGTLANLGSTISTKASVAFIYSQITPLVIRATINAKGALLAQGFRISLSFCVEVCASLVPVTAAMAIRMSIARTIVAATAALSIGRAIIDKPVLIIRTFNEPVDFGLIINAVGHLTTIVSAIGVTTASVATSMTAAVSRALILAASTARVVVTTQTTFVGLISVAVRSATVSAFLKGIKAISATIAAVPSIQLAPLTIFSHVIVAKVVVATAATLGVLVQLTAVFQFAINTVGSALAVVFGRAIRLFFLLAAPFGALSIVSSNIFAHPLVAISAVRASMGFLFTRLIQDAFAIAVSSEAASLSVRIRMTMNQVINDSRASVIASLTLLLHITIAAVAPHIAATLRGVVGPLPLGIAASRAGLAMVLRGAFTISRSISATAETVTLAAFSAQMKILIALTVRATAAQVAAVFHAIAPTIANIAARTTNMVTLRIIVAKAAQITASAASLGVNLVRGIYVIRTIAALGGSVIMSDTLRALIAATIGESRGLVQVALQIRLLLNQTISVISATLQALVSQQLPPFTKLININDPLAPQTIPINGTL